MEYLLKSSAIIILFYACYKIFLQRDTFFELNRWFLLIGLLCTASISFVVIPNYIEYTPVEITYTTSVASNLVQSEIIEESINYEQILFAVYWLGVALCASQLIMQFFSLRRIITNGTPTKIGRFRLVETQEQIAPFSFFNFIVYNPEQFDPSELEHVINHEKAHSKQYHSLDNILSQITCILLWFNPFVWLYKKSLQQNLEFIADQEAQYVSPCERSYQTVLLKASVTNHDLVFTNNFYTSLIKKRIVMLHKSKSKRTKQLKLLIVLPLLGLFIMSFNTKDIYVEVPSNEYNLMEDLLRPSEVVEIIITKNTSDADLASIKKDLEDKGFTFEYNGVKRNSEGEITAISVEFSNGNSSSKHKVKGNNGIKSFKFTGSENNMDISGMEDGNTFTYSNSNGTKTVTTTTSKVIVIDDEDSDTTIDVQTIKGKDTTFVVKKSNSDFFSTEGDDTKFVIRESSDEPLFIIDGEPVKKSLFEDVDSDDIESIFILKGDDAISKYGKSGENGVVIMKKKGGDNIFIESERDEIIMESTNKFVIDNDGKGTPLIIVDNVIVEEKIVKDLDPSKIHSVEVIKDEASVKVYGERGKDGVIKITTSKKKGLNSEEDTIVIVEELESDVHETHELLITKNATDSELNLKKQQLKSMGIDAKFSKVRRNKAGEITSIKITLDDNNGRVSTSSWREKTKSIPNIVLGKRGDKLFIQADQ